MPIYTAEHKPQDVTVTKKNDDGTVNVKREDGREFHGVPVSQKSGVEGCVFIEPSGKASEPDSSGKKGK